MELSTEQQIKTLAEDINKSIKGLEEKAKDGTDAAAKVKELQTELAVLQGLSKEQIERVDEIIVKMNTPGGVGKAAGIDLSGDLEEKLKSGIENKNFDNRFETASLRWANGHKGVSKAVGTITSANFTSDGTTPTAVNPDYSQTVVGTSPRRVHMRNIITQTPMSGDSFRYPQLTGHGEGDFGIQIPGQAKNQIEEDYQVVILNAQTIAGYYRVAKQNLADIPWLAQSLLTEGTERYLKAEDKEILYGVGGDNAIKGVNQYATAYAGAMPDIYQALLNPAIALMDADKDPTGILLRPSAYGQLLTYKTTTGEYNSPMLFLPNQNMPMNIAGVPIYMSTAVAANQVFVGDWSAQNIQIRVREGLSVDFSYEDQDNFIKNLVTIRIEARIGLQVSQLNSFYKLDLSEIAPIV
ncbi:phage major capsid protein [Dyadobacter sp. CY351]|uniref:phage major capsid protein n=1 Tax=Dyadobacter sp. CY351 TaxID=2909337 RepID=UPI001F25B6B1|nr:phage major capsid protein [Dyadobacter sp. CY351]MCF2517132.1 phage major capsid protein [Dyadobacter sp. CY351]